MSFEQDYAAPRSPLPPPPPPPHPHIHHQAPQSPLPHSGHSSQTSPLRRIAVQPPLITTALAPPQGTSFLHSQTPISAVSLSVPLSPYGPPSSTYAASPVSSPMAMRHTSSVPYNPQQWAGGTYLPRTNTQASSSRTRPQDVTGMEASMPSPPPPYSPAPNQNLSHVVSNSPHMSSNAFTPPANPPTIQPGGYVPSPPSRPTSSYNISSRPESMVVPSSATSITSNQQFPPPPPRNGSERTVSRDRLHSKFSLSALRNRNSDQSPAPTAIESLRVNTSEAISATVSPGARASQPFFSGALPDRRWSPDTQSPIRAPNARRAVSTGALALGSEARTPIESPIVGHGGWGNSVPLPPPPPGPPPSSSRSQSVGHGVDSSSSLHARMAPAPPTRRPGQSSLGPIPPTPVGWTEEEARTRSRSPGGRGLQIDTSPQAINQRQHAIQQSESEDMSTSSGPTASTSSSTLYRQPQRRDPSVRGIRERRSESRAARERVEPSNNPWADDLEAAAAKPADLVLGTPDGSLARRGAVKTPRSGSGIRSPRSSQLLDEPGSSNSTPRISDHHRRLPSGAAPTPPFSPGTDNFEYQSRKATAAIPTKALPTPPLRSYGDDLASSGLTNNSGSAARSTSIASHLSEALPEASSSSTPRPTDRDTFAQASIERHRLFIEKEAAAQSDQDRLELFAEFIVAESRLRRDRYSGAFDAMASEVLDLTRDLWRSYASTGRRSATPGAQSTSVVSGRRSQASTHGESPDTRFSNSVPTTAASPASSVANFTPHTEPASPSSATSQRARDQPWNNNFQPCLSPIPSMAMSTVPDEEDSRGRSASRWWEASHDGASSGVGSRRLERSKRESKYMGVPKEARESLQWANDSQASPANPEASSQQGYGPNEYPAEKAGWHDEAQSSAKSSQGYYPSPAPMTPDPHRLDVSRLVTLPPPYPRHHPAVNNSHPDLNSIRSTLRLSSELGEVKTTKERFTTKIQAHKEQESTSLAERRSQLRFNIEQNVKNGVMNFTEAAKAENDFETREHKRAQETVQYVFDTFQADVANPLHAMFCERINKVSASIEHLKARLKDDAQELNPDHTQEEGDDKPELLEILTLLKWLFESREQLHKEMFELEDERNDLYKDIIILPYIQTKNDQKVKEASNFFGQDARDRKVTWEKEILKRYEEFMNIVETNVTRGVEAQLSAFWDIAPGLLAIVQKVPQRLRDFDIVIPPQEYEENPAYHDFPLQYLYTLLAHAGRSAYQFIESQINLLCLLHEVKTGVMTAGSRLLETQRILEGEDLASVDTEMRAIREDEESRLTEDLKDKVGLVESQWGEALGNGMDECKNRVEAFLVQQNGWDDALKE
ncbi:hypothetical protein BU24DRAFT_339311 [Aaosphaeria arxii CBS 175.79]|uniref:Uncharacterized protein n=1 Tax=Aaosphaeria arxii CBS 175.79 TaxID=1450172 RepID=A0A6A5Y5A3_9PLEO|nr:uncharacterized protein BU24DRAFT_339311 [Aaosphaeria arxii CBS 175.79]KAF2020668.1 hypothetical protein BU24DRAFT_339311 [Aaosphaeria arxii CBS 175.79]